MKVELGSGGKDTWTEGYKHLDVRNIGGLDYVSDIRDLPFKDGEVEEFLAYHVLEHVGREDAKKVLSECYRCLKTNGTLLIKCPNLYYNALEYVKLRQEQFKNDSVENVQRIYDLVGWFYGGQDYEENIHKFIFDFWVLKEFLISAGFRIVDFMRGFNFNTQNLGIVAIK